MLTGKKPKAAGTKAFRLRNADHPFPGHNLGVLKKSAFVVSDVSGVVDMCLEKTKKLNKLALWDGFPTPPQLITPLPPNIHPALGKEEREKERERGE